MNKSNQKQTPKVSINLVVMNGEKYIHHCLDAVFNQSYTNVEINILDNNSTDNTVSIIKKKYSKCNLITIDKNLGLGGGQEYLLDYSTGQYIVALCVDVILDQDFVVRGIEGFSRHQDAGALQSKMYQWSIKNEKEKKINVIDSCGFKILPSRKLINRGHGENDANLFMEEEEIFSFEGAAPFFRKEAMINCKVKGEIYDKDLFWYATDIDFGWKMRLLGWTSWYIPSMRAWHDRPTSKDQGRSLWDYITFKRQLIRSRVSRERRRLQFRNLHLVYIKYDSWNNVFHNPFAFVGREIMVFLYHILFEPFVFLEIPNFFKKLPLILQKRKLIQERSKISTNEIQKWFNPK